MERNEFLKVLGQAGLLACAGCAMESCSSNDPEPKKVDFTVDISVAPNTALQTAGGSISKDGVVVARPAAAAEFVALAQACTHEGTAINFSPTQGNFVCPNHGSKFSTTGTVLLGPATTALQKFNTQVTGNNVRVFS